MKLNCRFPLRCVPPFGLAKTVFRQTETVFLYKGYYQFSHLAWVLGVVIGYDHKIK